MSATTEDGANVAAAPEPSDRLASGIEIGPETTEIHAAGNPTTPSVTWPQVLAWRLHRQFLDRPTATGVVGVVERLAGVQAQVASAADLAVRVRQKSPVPGAVAAALGSERSLVKTWAMRGTLHLLPAAEAGNYLSLIGSIRTWEKPAWQKAFGATPADVEAIAAAVTEALADGSILTREELVAEVLARTASEHLAGALGSGWGALLKPLAWQGLLANGPSQGSRVTFVSPAAFFPGWQSLPAPAAAATVVIRRYLRAHGPATPGVFNAWLSRGAVSKSVVRRWFDQLGDDLASVDVEGTAMLACRDDLQELRAQVPSELVHLLPGFDQYVMAAGTSAKYLVPPARRASVSRAAGWISPVVLYAGRVVGTWSVHHGAVSVELFEAVPAGPLDAAINRVSSLLDGGVAG